MAEPVLVVHGVANRNKEDFENQVHVLNTAVGQDRRLIPVYWGDLGAGTLGLDQTLLAGAMEVVRAAAGPETINLFEEFSIGSDDASLVRGSESRKQEIEEGVIANLNSLSSAGSQEILEAVRSVLQDQWLETRWLHAIDDNATLRKVGGSLGDSLQKYLEKEESGLVRGAIRDKLTEFAAGVLHGLDQAVGMQLGRVLGSMNQYVRQDLLPGIAEFLGDVLVYQRRRAEIHRRVQDVLAANAPGYGSRECPISVLAHSLGGVISFDLAVASEPRLWIKSLITFGSQSAFFHVLDPRGGELVSYVPGQTVVLPASLSNWINLCEPMDPLAFAAGRVFRLHTGESPRDVLIPHLLSSGFWTHSAYWKHPDLVKWIKRALDGDALG